MLIGHVSDERYIALHDVQFEIASETLHVETRSRATGEIFADIPPDPYNVTCQKTAMAPSRGKYGSEDYAPLSFDRPEPINHIPKGIQATDPIAGRVADSSPGSNARALPTIFTPRLSFISTVSISTATRL